MKDLTTRAVIHRCNISSDLYPLFSSTDGIHRALIAVSEVIWHRRLGHPGAQVLSNLRSTSVISMSRNKTPVTPFQRHLSWVIMFIYRFLHQTLGQNFLLSAYIVICGPRLFLVFRGLNITLCVLMISRITCGLFLSSSNLTLSSICSTFIRLFLLTFIVVLSSFNAIMDTSLTTPLLDHFF